MAAARLKKLHHLDRRCSYCKRPTILNDRPPEFWTELDATTDHVIPSVLGGDNTRDDVTLACRTCNQVKDDMTPAQWFTFMNVNPRWWERFKWGQKYPRLNRMVEHNAALAPPVALKYENAWQRDWREWNNLDWPWLKDLTRQRLWQVGFGPWQ